MTEPIQEPADADAAPDEGEPAEPVAVPEPSEEEQEAEEEHEVTEAPEEPAEPQPQGLSEKEVERAFQKLDKSANVWRRRVGEIMGEDVVMLQDCPLCEPIIPGFVMPTPELPERFPAVRTFIGDRAPENWQVDTRRHRCEACDGYGEVLTGSRRPEQEVMPCVDCGGKGWVGEAGAPFAPAVATATGPMPSNGPVARSVTHEEQAVIEELRAKGIVVYVPPAPPAPVP